MDIKGRFKNKGFILACCALVFMICRDFFNIHLDAGIFSNYVDLIVYFVIGAGVFNDPLTGQWFGDTGSKG